MSRSGRIIRNVAIGIGVLTVVVMVVALVVVHTSWFRETLRQKIIASAQEATGGRVELGSFDFDVSDLRAVVTNFVIHGKEPADAAPFIRIDRVEVRLKFFGISYLAVHHPQVNVIVFPDGTTSIPSPKESGTSDQSPLATVVDLKVGRFELTNGLAEFAHRKQELNLRGNNLRAALDWNVLKQSYQGQFSIDPLYVVAGKENPVNFRITLPVVLARDRIDVKDASLTGPQTNLRINAWVENMKDPKTSAHVQGHAALADLKSAGALPVELATKNVPTAVDLDANATIDKDTIQIAGLRLGVGKSTIEASGTLQDPKGNGSLQFKSDLALGEIGRLAKVSARPEGRVLLNGTVKLDKAYNYDADGNIQAKNVSVVQDGQAYRNINLFSAVHADPHHIDFKGLRLAAFGGEFAGNAGLEDFARYRVDGNLRNLDVQQTLRQLAPKQRLPYEGVVSGAVNATGDIKTPGVASLVAATHLTIAPGPRGIPVSGKINADYRGSSGQIALQDSFVTLPHSKLTLNGSVGKQLNVTFTSTNLGDLPVALPVALNRGQVNFAGSVTGSVTNPRVAGHIGVDHFSVEGRVFDSLQADVAASKSDAAVNNGVLARAAMRATFGGRVGLSNWTAPPSAPVSATVALRNGDLADMMALAGQPPAGYSGALTADAQINGTVGNPTGSASIAGAKGMIDGEPFDQVQANVRLSDQLVTIPSAYVTSGPSRIDVSGEFRHPRDSFMLGHVHAHAQSNQFELAQITALQKQQPNTSGVVKMDTDMTGDLGSGPLFLLTSVNGNASVRGLHFQGQNLGDTTADARTSGSTVSYHLNNDVAGSTIRVAGSTQLSTDYPTTADATLRNVNIAPFLALAKQDVPARGVLSGTAHVSGTLDNPQGNADLDLSSAVVYDEPLDHVRLRATYAANAVDVQQFEAVAGPSRIGMTARFDHPPDNFESGRLQFRITSGNVDLARIHNVQKMRPGIGGRLQIAGDGGATVSEKAPCVLLTSLNANVAANGVSVQGKNFGDLSLTANTTSADRVNFALKSNLAGSTIDGSGNAQLTGAYPVNAQLTFKDVMWLKLQPLIGATNGAAPSFDGVVDGKVTVDGPAMNVDQLRGALSLSRLSATTIPPRGSMIKPVSIQNDGPITASLDKGTVRLESLKLTGPKTNITASGTASIQGQNLNVRVNGNADLTLLQVVSQDIDSSGNVVLAATVRGAAAKPLVNGTLDLRGARFYYAGVANGISNANGTIVFNGNSANIRNLTAESGGGTINASGFVGYSEALRFGLHATASKVRVQLQPGAGAITNADIHMTGTTDHSLISGTVTIDSLNYLPQSDLGSLLSRAAPPVQAPSAPSPLLDNMRLDIRVRTSPALAVQASMAQNLQADADLRIRGTAAEPGVLGRVNITEGQLVFFGSTYTVNSGSIGFYNPIRIDPVLDISLETQAKGVDVVLHVTGPIDNMKLSYTSDPPLQFQEIISLLAAGKTPTSDPTLLANQPSQPAQSFQQMGESALVSKALADPVSNRLQRVFGVSQLKIDPSFTNGSQLPTARLTLQQHVSSNITFTYVSALNDPNATVIKVEWAFNPQWSAVATRDDNGIFSVNFLYKKQFR
jgi:translocation and assembly module TamB